MIKEKDRYDNFTPEEHDARAREREIVIRQSKAEREDDSDYKADDDEEKIEIYDDDEGEFKDAIADGDDYADKDIDLLEFVFGQVDMYCFGAEEIVAVGASLGGRFGAERLLPLARVSEADLKIWLETISYFGKLR